MRRLLALAVSLVLHALLVLALRFDPAPAATVRETVVALDLTVNQPARPPEMPDPDLPMQEPLPVFRAVAAPAPAQPPPEAPPPVATRELRPKPVRPPAVARPAPAMPDRARQDYVLEVVRKLSGARIDEAQEPGQARIVIVRLTVGRDGRLLHLAMTSDSGSPVLDRRVLDAIRRAAPFAPLPPDAPTDRLSFVVPIALARQAP